MPQKTQLLLQLELMQAKNLLRASLQWFEWSVEILKHELYKSCCTIQVVQLEQGISSMPIRESEIICVEQKEIS